MDEGDSRVHNYPPRWNGARRNRQTGAVSLDPLRCGLIPYFGGDPKGGRKPINAKCETVRTLPTFCDAIGGLPDRWRPEHRNSRLPRQRSKVVESRSPRSSFRPRPRRLAFCLAFHRWRLRVLDLEPMIRSPGSIWRAKSL